MAEIGDQGLYDASTFVAGNPATWPRPLDLGPYRAGQYWTASVAGVVGVPVAVGDRVYVTSPGRSYGSYTYGDAAFGWDPAGPWYDIEVAWLAFPASSPPWDRPASPFTGCPFGERAPGWRVVIESLQLPPDSEARTYGDLGYGDLGYGDDVPTSATQLQWVDITPTGYAALIARGNPDGSPVVPVAECRIDFRDTDASVFAMTQPESWFAPRIGTRIRLGLLSPSLAYSALFVGRIEEIIDVHDVAPRIVSVTAFGSAMDLASDALRWQRPAENAPVRASALITASGYDWAPPTNLPPVVPLIADTEKRDVVIRDELDRTAVSAGSMFDVAPNGAIRFTTWPAPGTVDVIEVADCAPGLIGTAVIVGDMSELVNVALVANSDDVTAESTDPASIKAFGRRTNAVGMPLPDLATTAGFLPGIATVVRDTFSRTVNRVESIEADIRQDPAWFDELLTLDLGASISYTRRAFLPDHPLVLEGVVCGYEHRLEPNRWSASIFTSNRTPSI